MVRRNLYESWMLLPLPLVRRRARSFISKISPSRLLPPLPISPLPRRLPSPRQLHHRCIRQMAPADSPSGGTSQHKRHHHPVFPPCATFHRAMRRSTWDWRSAWVPELSRTNEAYGSLDESGSWEEMRDEACSGVRGGFEGRDSSRESCSFSFLHDHQCSDPSRYADAAVLVGKLESLKEVSHLHIYHDDLTDPFPKAGFDEQGNVYDYTPLPFQPVHHQTSDHLTAYKRMYDPIEPFSLVWVFKDDLTKSRSVELHIAVISILQSMIS